MVFSHDLLLCLFSGADDAAGFAPGTTAQPQATLHDSAALVEGGQPEQQDEAQHRSLPQKHDSATNEGKETSADYIIGRFYPERKPLTDDIGLKYDQDREMDDSLQQIEASQKIDKLIRALHDVESLREAPSDGGPAPHLRSVQHVEASGSEQRKLSSSAAPAAANSSSSASQPASPQNSSHTDTWPIQPLRDVQSLHRTDDSLQQIEAHQRVDELRHAEDLHVVYPLENLDPQLDVRSVPHIQSLRQVQNLTTADRLGPTVEPLLYKRPLKVVLPLKSGPDAPASRTKSSANAPEPSAASRQPQPTPKSSADASSADAGNAASESAKAPAAEGPESTSADRFAAAASPEEPQKASNAEASPGAGSAGAGLNDSSARQYHFVMKRIPTQQLHANPDDDEEPVERVGKFQAYNAAVLLYW